MTTTRGGRAPRPLPPGRFGAPWLGETLALVRSNHGFYKDRLAAYGPIFKTRLFGSDFVVFSGHEAFHVFATDPRIERGDADPITAEKMFRGSLALIDGDEHHLRKALMLRGVGFRSAIEAYVPRMQQLIGEVVSGWMSRPGPITIQPDLQRLAARMTGALYTGDESEEAAAEIDAASADARDAFMTLPVPLPWTKFGRAIKGRDRLARAVDVAVARHQDGEFDDITSRLLAAARDAEVPIDAVKGDLRHLIFASQGGYFVPFVLVTMVLAQHPDIRERAREEVLRIAPEGEVTLDQLQRMDYLEQVSKELRRYFAMNSATFFGRVKEPMEVGGYRIPAGWGAIGGIHINMRNPDVFPDPDRFDPSRFEPARESALPPGSYVPHGDGHATHHRCPGENIVTVAVQLYLTLLLRHATWTLPDQDLTLTNELFPLPVSGLAVDFRAHVPAVPAAGETKP
ncbi:cytochrome P450 [Microbacterium cremeum]|uniref:cytochrome P450 n=1 Tax=Microbacterium cremeum TaxID=2782169 RepID=UPI0018879A78|nr:cytochrome P450 [Microbacterium cremeum]